jgi:hypothetical protein
VLPLRHKFSECLLHTPTITRINEALRGNGYSIARAEFEQFWINKDKKEPTFFSIIVLVVEPSGEKGKKQNKASLPTGSSSTTSTPNALPRPGGKT